MDDQYARAFDAIYRLDIPSSSQEAFGPAYRDLQELIDGIEEELRSDNMFLRPDAKVALITNAISLGALPLGIAGSGPDMGALRKDVRTVAYGATEFGSTGVDGGTEITSHAVFESITRNWSQLQLTVPDYWA